MDGAPGPRGKGKKTEKKSSDAKHSSKKVGKPWQATQRTNALFEANAFEF